MKTSLSQLNFLFGVKLSLNEAQMCPVLLLKTPLFITVTYIGDSQIKFPINSHVERESIILSWLYMQIE